MLTSFFEGWTDSYQSFVCWVNLVTQPYTSKNKIMFDIMLYLFQTLVPNKIEKRISDILDAL